MNYSRSRAGAAFLLVLFSCADDAPPNQRTTSSAGGRTRDAGAGSANSGGAGATNDDAQAGSSNDGDSGVYAPIRSATPAEPCGSDLNADNGEVLPDLGRVESGGMFKGDPLDPGPFKIVKREHKIPNPDATLNDVPLTIYAPSRDGNTVELGPHPMVMVMPGYGKGLGLTLSGLHKSYAFYSEHLASHGFVVVGMSFIAGGLGLPLVTTENLGAHFLTQQAKNVAEVKAVLDFVLEQSDIKAQIDDSKIAIAGHSQGGKVAFFSAVEDARFDLVIGWDPQNAAGGTPCAGAPDTCNLLPIAPICPDPSDPSKGDSGRMHELHAETLVFAARDSGTILDTHQFAEHFYRGAPSPAHMILFKQASHDNFSDGDNPVAQVTMRAQLALLLTRFRGMSGLQAYLPGSDALVEGIPGVEQHSK